MKKGSKIRQIQFIESFENGFEEVYVEYFKPLYLYARKITKSKDLAKDVVSDVFYNLWKSQSDFSKIRELKSYLFIAVKNQAIRTLSRDPKDFISFDQESFINEIEKVNPEEILLEKELLALIEEVVAKLPDQCQLIFDMAKNKQMNYQEIALELDISVSTVGTQVGRAIHTLRQAISHKFDEENHHRSSGLELGGVLLLISFIFG